MRRKLLVSLVSACALVGVLIGPASASASKLTLNNGLGAPASTAKFHGLAMTVSNSSGSWSCEGFDLSTNITKNSANPVTLNITSGTLGTCKTSAERNLTYSEFESSSPMILNPDGSGTIAIRVKEVYTDKGKVLSNCKREGTLTLTKVSTNPLQFSFTSNELKGAGCGHLYVKWSGNFQSVTDEFGMPIEWSVPPSLDNSLGGAASSADFWDAKPTVTTGFGKVSCEEFKLRTSITKNEANPVTLVSSGTSTLSGCKFSGGSPVTYSGIETTSAMTLNANNTGSLPLRLTETNEGWNCVRQGTLSLTLTPSQGDVAVSGTLTKVSGSSLCPTNATFAGTFLRSTDEIGGDLKWVGFS